MKIWNMLQNFSAKRKHLILFSFVIVVFCMLSSIVYLQTQQKEQTGAAALQNR